MVIDHLLFRFSVDGSESRRFHLLRLVVYLIFYKVLAPSQVVGNGISEPSTVMEI